MELVQYNEYLVSTGGTDGFVLVEHHGISKYSTELISQ